MNLGFRGEDEDGGIYHSTYDSFDHFIRFGDPKFVYGVSLAQTAGRLVLRAADAEVLPMRLGDLADSVARYVAEVEKLTETEREDTARLNALVDEGGVQAGRRSRRRRALAPSSPGRRAHAGLRGAGPGRQPHQEVREDLRRRLCACGGHGFQALERTTSRASTASCRGSSSALSSERGLPGRAWYKHMLYAPGLYTGYAAKTLPGDPRGDRAAPLARRQRLHQPWSRRS